MDNGIIIEKIADFKLDPKRKLRVPEQIIQKLFVRLMPKYGFSPVPDDDELFTYEGEIAEVTGMDWTGGNTPVRPISNTLSYSVHICWDSSGFWQVEYVGPKRIYNQFLKEQGFDGSHIFGEHYLKGLKLSIEKLRKEYESHIY